MELPEILTVGDVAKAMRKSTKWVREVLLVGPDACPYTREGRDIYVLRDDLLAHLRRRARERSQTSGGRIGRARERGRRAAARG